MTQSGGDSIADAHAPSIDPRLVSTATGTEPGSGSVAKPSRRQRRKDRQPSTTRTIAEWTLVLGGALIVAVLIRNYLFTTFWIPSPSMQPTLIGDPSASGRHDRIVINRLSYKLHSVHRGDIVVFSTPKTEAAVTPGGKRIKDLIKRVVGLPGETVTLKDGHVYIDGKLLNEPYLPAGTKTVPICTLQSTFKIPPKSVLVLGDNRGDSSDGRCFGPIEESTILGRAFIRIWPITKITWL